MRFVPAQPGICGFEVIQQSQLFIFPKRGGVIMYHAKHRVGTVAVCSHPLVCCRRQQRG